MIIVSASTFAVFCLIVLMIVLGGANAVGLFISTNMTAILIAISIFFLIRLIILCVNFVSDYDGIPSTILSVLLQLAESAFGVFVCYKALIYLVISSDSYGFFGFGFDMILWALLIVGPILFGMSIGTVLSCMYTGIAGAPVSSIFYLISFFLLSLYT